MLGCQKPRTLRSSVGCQQPPTHTHLTGLQQLTDRRGLHISMEHPGKARSAFLIMRELVAGGAAGEGASLHHRLDPSGPQVPLPSSHGSQRLACLPARLPACQPLCLLCVLHSPPSLVYQLVRPWKAAVAASLSWLLFRGFVFYILYLCQVCNFLPVLE